MMCPSRHAIVVTGGGTGSGIAKSIVESSPPAAIGAVAAPTGAPVLLGRSLGRR
jgi:hypothetical protein